MPQDVNPDIAAIREWLAKEPHLPQDFDDFMLRKFLHSCYGSLERTKRCIDKFCTTRSLMPEIYTCRDPESNNMKIALDCSYATCVDAGDYELLLYYLDDPGLGKVEFYDFLKSFALQADYWVQHVDVFPKGHILVLDMTNITLKIVPKLNIMYFRDYINYVLESFPIRVTQVHIVNSPPYVETLYGLVKPVLPAEIKEIVNFHPDTKPLHKIVDKKFLPKEYGGDAATLRQNQLKLVRQVLDNRTMFLDDNMWKADLKQKSKSNSQDGSMNGSFRTLSID